MSTNEQNEELRRIRIDYLKLINKNNELKDELEEIKKVKNELLDSLMQEKSRLRIAESSVLEK